MEKTLANKPVRVCFFSLKAYPLFNPSVKASFNGACVDPYLLATELAKDKNFHISFIVGDYGQSALELIENVAVIKSVDMNRNLFLGGRKTWKAFKKADADIYLAKSLTLATTLCAFFCKCHNRPFVWRSASSSQCDGTFTKENPFKRKLFFWAIRRADTIITQNHADAENIRKIFGLSAIAIPNGHKLTSPASRGRNSILWVGNSDPIKQPQLFLELARQMPQQDFIMICQKGDKDKNYSILVNKANAIKNLQFISRVPFHQIDEYFLEAKVLVNTSLTEGFPNTFIEAGKAATPILSLNVNPDDFISKYECGLCCGGVFNKLTENLKYMLSENHCVNYGKNARKYVEQNHDITKTVEEYKKMFNELIS